LELKAARRDFFSRPGNLCGKTFVWYYKSRELLINGRNEQAVDQLIEGCKKGRRDSQQKLYRHFYGFAMGKCLRFSGNRYEADEILNDGFLKVFRNIQKYDAKWPFHTWLSRIMTNTAIDHYRAELRHSHTQELTIAEDITAEADAYHQINYKDLLVMVQRLPVSYRTVFNLFAIDGYSHEEIADLLGISVGTSKSNLFKARQKLQKALKEWAGPDDEGNAKIVNLNPVSGRSGIINGGFEP
jgi:RNA polymerase sigma factor (sigma-70 family)